MIRAKFKKAGHVSMTTPLLGVVFHRTVGSFSPSSDIIGDKI